MVFLNNDLNFISRRINGCILNLWYFLNVFRDKIFCKNNGFSCMIKTLTIAGSSWPNWWCKALLQLSARIALDIGQKPSPTAPCSVIKHSSVSSHCLIGQCSSWRKIQTQRVCFVQFLWYKGKFFWVFSPHTTNPLQWMSLTWSWKVL